MSDDFPPPYLPPDGGRIVVDKPIEVIKTIQDGVKGIHLMIENTSYFVERDAARRVARHILFGVDE